MKIVRFILWLAILCYPIFIFLSLKKFSSWQFALILVLFAGIRFILAGDKGKSLRLDLFFSVALVVVAILTVMSGQLLPLRYYPLFCSLVMLCVFLYTLIRPPSLIERIARLTHDDLPDKAISYTRRVTQIWCVFLIVNTAIVYWTIFYASWELWSIYNGVVSYIFIGILILGERIYRHRVLKIR